MLFNHGIPKIKKLFSLSEISFSDTLVVGDIQSFSVGVSKILLKYFSVNQISIYLVIQLNKIKGGIND